MDPKIAKKTQDTLGKIIKKPPLTDKLLGKPPFRFLHDIMTSVIKTTGFMQGLFTEAEMNSENVKDKDAKIAFLQKAIDMVSAVTGKALSVRPAKIVAGHEPERTNEFLQALTDAINKNVDNDEYVRRVLKGGRAGGSSKDEKKEDKKDKARSEEKRKGQDSEEKGGREKEGKKSEQSVDAGDQEGERKRDRDRDKDRDKDRHRDRKQDRDREKDRHGEKKSDRDGEKERERHKDRDRESKTRDKSREGREERSKEKERSKKHPELSPHTNKQLNKAKRLTYSQMIKPYGHSQSTAVPESRGSTSGASAENFANDMNCDAQKPASATEFRRKPLFASKCEEDPYLDSDLQEAITESIMDHQSLSIRRDSILYNGQPFSVITGLEAVASLADERESLVIGDNWNRDLSRDKENESPDREKLQGETEERQEPPTRLQRPASAKGSRRRREDEEAPRPREPMLGEEDLPPQVVAARQLGRPSSARPAPPRPKQETLESEPAMRLGSGQPANVIADNDDDDDDDDNFLVQETAPPPPDPDLSQLKPTDDSDTTHGALVQKMLESKKEVEKGPQGTKRTEIERPLISDAQRRKQREIVQKEVDKLRSSIQNLTRSANPLGKVMDYLQEDLDSMQQELDKWRAENAQHALELKREMSVTDQAVEPLRQQLAELDRAINDQLDRIAAVKSNIIKNDQKMQKMLQGISSS
ncbi:hypothetical protein BsWGS_25719 [Bradybaena similaris]